MTKAITSLAAMQLIEQGRLGLEDPAEKYLPELADLIFHRLCVCAGPHVQRRALRA